MWKGAAAILKKKAMIMHRRAFSISDVENEQELLISEKSNEKLSKWVVPVQPYKNEIPSNNRPEEKLPIIKYFKPASVENDESFFAAAKT